MVSQSTSSLSIKEIQEETIFSGFFQHGIARDYVTFPFHSIELKPSDAYPWEFYQTSTVAHHSFIKCTG